MGADVVGTEVAAAEVVAAEVGVLEGAEVGVVDGTDVGVVDGLPDEDGLDEVVAATAGTSSVADGGTV